MIQKAKKFIGEVRTELSKATWPWDPREKGIKKYRELIDSTGVVLVAMVMLGAFVALSDFFLVNAVSAFTRTGIEERVRRPKFTQPEHPADAKENASTTDHSNVATSSEKNENPPEQPTPPPDALPAQSPATSPE